MELESFLRSTADEDVLSNESFFAHLGSPIANLLTSIGKAADAFGAKSYLVGGMVRDVLLQISTFDIDIMIDGKVTEFLPYLKKNWSCYFPSDLAPEKMVLFRRYGTGKLLFTGELRPGVSFLDFSTVRDERYPIAGGKPDIIPGTLATDLARRDFTVNALCVALYGGALGEVIDLFHGREHLLQRRLVVLHEKSFIDDPARLLRALRLIGRLGFNFDSKTKDLFDRAIEEKYLHLLPRPRLFDEFRKLLCEEQVGSILQVTSDRGVLTQIHPRLVWTANLQQLFREHSEIMWEERLAHLFSSLTPAAYQQLLSRDFQLSSDRVHALARAQEKVLQNAS